MPSEVLAPGTSEADSSDITVSGATLVNIGLYLAVDDGLEFSDGSGRLLLPSGDLFLLPDQVGDAIPFGIEMPIKRKDPTGEYNITNLVLDGRTPNHLVGPGTYHVHRPEIFTGEKIGVQKD